MSDAATASLAMEGDTQVVRLPEPFRLPGTEVSVRRSGDSLVLEPIHRRKSPEEIREILADLERMAAEDGPFMPEGREQPPMPDDDHKFDDLP